MGKRNVNLDLVRCVAVLSVLSVNFFLNNGFYGSVISGKSMYVATVARQAFVICVPLFILLTGYLMNKKKFSLSYFLGIRKVLVVYLLCTICIWAYKLLYLKEPFSILNIIFNITSYQQYSWYVEMYIGLYLLIPFLNILYHGLGTKKEKRLLIWIMIILTTLPSVFNTSHFKIVPEWWKEIYPLAYYFIGAYISEFQSILHEKISKKTHGLLMFSSIVLWGTYSYIRSYGGMFKWGEWCAYGGFTNVINAWLVFTFFLRIDVSRLGNVWRRIIIKVSELSLAIYLVSWIVDDYAYRILNARISEVNIRIFYYPVMFVFVFGVSFVLAYVVHSIFVLLDRRRKSSGL